MAQHMFGNIALTLAGYIVAMQQYKRLVFQPQGSAEPLEVKLNRHDGFIRLSGPLYEVVQLHRKPAMPWQATVSNMYGVPLFTLHHQPGNSEQFQASMAPYGQVQVKRQGQQWLVQADAIPVRSFSCPQADAHADAGEKEMIAAAIASLWLYQQKYEQRSQVALH
jgi:hypothetical protein